MTKDYQKLWKGVTSTIDEARAVRTLVEILIDKEGRTFVSRLDRKDAELCIEVLDRGIAEHNLKPAEKQFLFLTLRRLAGYHGRLPDSMIIKEKVEIEDKMFASGGFADTRSGRYMGHLVAVKTLRVAAPDDLLKMKKRFCKEVILLGTVSHPNVLKFVGVQGDMDRGQFTIVSEWMVHGNILEFIKNNHANRLELLHGAAKGLKYLHDAGLTHGNLKGENILMSNDTPPRACLTDFCFTTMVFNPGQKLSCSAQLEGGTVMFMSPELLVPSRFDIRDSVPTPEADTYAFGLVIFQVLTGEIPFHGVGQSALVWSVIQGKRPAKPGNVLSIGFSDILWGFTQRCWDGDPKLRPKVTEVVMHLEREAANWRGLMPPCSQIENVASNHEEPTSDTLEYCGPFPPSSNVVSESPAELQTTSGPFDSLSTPSTQRGEPSQEASQAFKEPQPESRAPTQPWSERPQDNLRGAETYPHLDLRHDPPPSNLPQKKQKGHSKSFLRQLFGGSNR